MASICVFCGANPGSDPVFADVAASVGRAVANGGHRLVYGGGRVGLMGIVADAVLAGGGEVLGVMPRALVEREIDHPGITESVVTETMHERKQTMCDASDGFVALPGGFGTLDEVLEILTWNQIGIIAKPVAFLDVTTNGRGYFTSLLQFMDEAVDSGLIKSAHRAMARRATTAAEAIEIATGAAPWSPSKWTDPTVR